MLLSIPNNIHHPQNHQSYQTASLHSLLLKIGVKTRKHFVISRNRVIFAGNHNLTIHNKDNEWQHLYKERTGEQPEECIIGNPKKQVYRDFRCLRLRLGQTDPGLESLNQHIVPQVHIAVIIHIVIVSQ